MQVIALKFMYDPDLISVPQYVADDIQKIRRQFDKWLYDKTNDHGYWVCIEGRKRAVSFDSEAFVDYLNKFHVKNANEKVRYIERKATEIPVGIPVVYF